MGYSSHRNTNIIREKLTVLAPMSEDIQIIRKSAEENTPPSRRIRDFFGSFVIDDADFQDKKRTIVPGTATWILEEYDYTDVRHFPPRSLSRVLNGTDSPK